MTLKKQAAAVLKVNGLKWWVTTTWSDGLFTRGMDAIKTVGDRLLFGRASTAEPQLVVDQHPANDRSTLLAPNPGTPSTAGSDQFFAGFFADHGVSLATALQKDGFTAEIDKFKTFISRNNFENIKRIKSSTAFWEQNSRVVPHIARLFLLLNTIPSTSASIERYFSICGFVSNKRSSNIAPDLFITRCLLRANLGLLTELTVSNENSSTEITA